MKQKYYFQIFQPTKEWSQIIPQVHEFKSWEAATKKAHELADTHKKEVRLTDNAALAQGTYISPNKNLKT